MSDNTTATKGDTMLTVTYRVFEKDLNRTFENVKTVQTMADFRLFACSLYSGNWEIVSVSE